MTLTRGTERVTARKQAAVAVLVAAAIVIGLWSGPPTLTSASVTIDLQRLPVGEATEVSWLGRTVFAGVSARGELDRRRPPADSVMALVGVSPDGRYEVTRQDTRVVWVLRTDTGYPLFDVKAGSGSIRRAAWEPDGDLVLDIWHGGKAAAVRCTLQPACERAGGSTTRQTTPRIAKVMLKTSAELTSGVHLDREPSDDTGDTDTANDDSGHRVTERREQPTRRIAQVDAPTDPSREPATTETTARRQVRDWMSEAVEQYMSSYPRQFAYQYDSRDSSERDGGFEGWSRDRDGHDGYNDWRDGYFGDRHR